MPGIAPPGSPGPSYAFRIERRDQRCVVHLDGDLDRSTCSLIWPLIDDLVADQGLLDLEVDVSATTFVDLSGVRLLVATARRLELAEGRLVLTGVSPFLRRLLEILELDHHFDGIVAPAVPPLDGRSRPGSGRTEGSVQLQRAPGSDEGTSNGGVADGRRYP